MSWITEKIVALFNDIINGVISFLVGVINSIFADCGTILNSSEVISGITVSQVVAFTLVTVLAAKELLNVYILELDGDSETNPLDFLVKVAVAVALIASALPITNMLLSAADSFALEFISSKTFEVTFTADQVSGALEESGLSAITVLIFLIIYIFMLAMVGFKAGVRSAELALLTIIFPLFACDYVSISQEKWKAFFSSYMVVIFGYIVQMISLKLSFMRVASVTTSKSLTDFFIALVFLHFATKAPQWLEKFTYSSGTKKNVGGAVKGAGNVALRLMTRR